MIDRRTMLAAGAALAATQVVRARAEDGSQPKPSRLDRLVAKAREIRRRLEFDGKTYRGETYRWLVEQGRAAHFVMIGEEHGIAENPKLAAQWFGDLVPAGYSRVAVEIAAPMGFEIDRVLRSGGMPALEGFLQQPENAVAFFGMREEAEWLAAARRAVPGNTPILWGNDYDVAADRHLIAMLEAKPKPVAAARALASLKAASAASWAQYDRTRDPRFIYGFAGDPGLVRAVRNAWRNADGAADWILDTLENSFEINRLWISGQGWMSNQMRAANMRRNLLRHLDGERRSGATPKVFFKYGATHVVRGVTSVDTFDLGSLVPEIAAFQGGKAFQLLVVPGATSDVAQFNPSTFHYGPARGKDGYLDELGVLADAAWPDTFTLFETRPLKPFADDTIPVGVARAVQGFDAILIFSGSTPSANL